jgi:formylglycine-generating enzyme required for sulfatase activity
VKYLDATTGLWQHARLGSNAQHSAPAGSTIATGLLTPGSAFNATTNWGVGAFLYRSANGTGTFSTFGVQLRWNYGQNGIEFGNIAEVKVFALEMVYVPQGSFSVGSGGGELFHFKNGTTNTPWTINSEGAINMANSDGSLWAWLNTYIETATLPAAFPKGFAGFYLMKYSITQQQYVDFLNTLTRAQQNTRTATDLAVGVTSVSNRYVMSNSSMRQYRNGIRCDATIDANAPITFYCDLNGNSTGGEAADGQWVACNYLAWADVAAYLDWSGLRPITELEYEKACRGPVAPVANEYAWGSTSITGAANITNGGTINETSNTPGANAVYLDNANVQGPMRVGVFAAGATTRAQSGAGYYGALELSGNLWERAVTVGNAQGRAFTGAPGNGALDGTGNADAATWPATNAQGAGFRGGNWGFDATFMRVSDRNYAAGSLSGRSLNYGGRGCR